ncbi:unnamed protein product [Gadus morhua 'NCC']
MATSPPPRVNTTSTPSSQETLRTRPSSITLWVMSGSWMVSVGGGGLCPRLGSYPASPPDTQVSRAGDLGPGWPLSRATVLNRQSEWRRDRCGAVHGSVLSAQCQAGGRSPEHPASAQMQKSAIAQLFCMCVQPFANPKLAGQRVNRFGLR